VIFKNNARGEPTGGKRRTDMTETNENVKTTEEKSGTTPAGSDSSELLCCHAFDVYNGKVTPVLYACKYCAEITTRNKDGKYEI
jgi:hypothetical protein